MFSSCFSTTGCLLFRICASESSWVDGLQSVLDVIFHFFDFFGASGVESGSIAAMGVCGGGTCVGFTDMIVVYLCGFGLSSVFLLLKSLVIGRSVVFKYNLAAAMCTMLDEMLAHNVTYLLAREGEIVFK